METIGSDWLRLLKIALLMSVDVVEAWLWTLNDPSVNAADGIWFVGLWRRAHCVSSAWDLYLYLVMVEVCFLDGSSTQVRNGIFGFGTVLIPFQLRQWGNNLRLG
jgi:hypothetical protein